MARLPKPWYRQDRLAWFVTIAGVRHNLGPNKKAAFDQFYELMRKPEKKTVSAKAFAAIADAFLEWVQKNRSLDTYEWYRYRLERFCQRYPDLAISQLKPFHVQQWVDSYEALSRTSKRNYVRTVKRCVKWAKQQGYTEQNPVEDLEAPGAESRDLTISTDDFRVLLTKIPDEAMRELCLVAFETGCRPQEILAVEARHFESENERWVFPVKEAKGKKAPRIVYLSQDALRISKKLAATYPTGRLFRNSKGQAWTTSAVNCSFCRLQYRTGKEAMQNQGVKLDAAILEEIKFDEETIGKKLKDLTLSQRRRLANRAYARYATKYSLYALRHSWATNALRSGMDALTVAILMGHSDPSTLSKVYQHLAHSPEHMLKQARKALGQ